MSQKLTPKLVRKLRPEQNSKEVEKLQLSNQGLTEVFPSLPGLYGTNFERYYWAVYRYDRTLLQVGDLSTLRKLNRLDLAQNSIQSTSFAATCTGLKWLSLAHNPVSDLSPLSCLQSLQVRLVLPARHLHVLLMAAIPSALDSMDPHLRLAACEGPTVVQVLNIGHAKLTGKVKLGAMTSLGALILNDNALTSISGKTRPRLQTSITGSPCLAHTVHVALHYLTKSCAGPSAFSEGLLV